MKNEICSVCEAAVPQLREDHVEVYKVRGVFICELCAEELEDAS